MDKMYQLKINLMQSKPSIWRRFIVPEDINLYDLHLVIQRVMGWRDLHLHSFIINREIYNGSPEADDEYDEEAIRENKKNKKISLNSLVPREIHTSH